MTCHQTLCRSVGSWVFEPGGVGAQSRIWCVVSSFSIPVMLTSNRLSVADARAIIGLPAVRGSSSSTTDLSPLDQHRALPAHWDRSVPLPVREFGGTLKSRFAALARKSGAGRKETRDHGRSLVGRRANLEGRFGDDGDPGRVSPGTREPLVSPLQR